MRLCYEAISDRHVVHSDNALNNFMLEQTMPDKARWSTAVLVAFAAVALSLGLSGFEDAKFQSLHGGNATAYDHLLVVMFSLIMGIWLTTRYCSSKVFLIDFGEASHCHDHERWDDVAETCQSTEEYSCLRQNMADFNNLVREMKRLAEVARATSTPASVGMLPHIPADPGSSSY